MPEVTLIRHGQAQTGATDEASYDSLSDLGHQQARWLGEHFRQEREFDLILSGAMTRQVQTARGLELDIPHRTDPRLNEMDYFGLAESLYHTHGVAFPTTEEEFITSLPLLLDAWHDNKIADGLETYADFCARVSAALSDAAAHDGRVLLVTSTGVIATLAKLALNLDTERKSRMFLAVAHTSVHRFTYRGPDLHLTQFGGTPHLDHSDRVHAKTYA